MTCWPGYGRSAILAVMLSSLLSCGVLAMERRDLQDCESSSDVPRMIQACTAMVEEQRLPAEVRSLALLKRGFGNFALDKLDAAVTDFRAAIELDPKNFYAHHELGLALKQKNDLPGALAALEEAVKINPKGAASHLERGRLLAAHGQMDEAIQDYNTAITLGADENTAYAKEGKTERPAASRVQADYFVSRADARYLAGNFNDAIADYDRANAFPDREGYNLIWYTLARRSAGSPDAARDLVSGEDRWLAEAGRGANCWQSNGDNGLGSRKEWRSSMRGPFLQRSCQYGCQRLGIGCEGTINRTRYMPETLSRIPWRRCAAQTPQPLINRLCR